MNLDKESLEDFIGNIDNFYALNHSEKILYFGFYLQEIKSYEMFRPTDIEKCYDLMDLPKSSNTRFLMRSLMNSKNLVPKNKGYRLSKPELDRIKKSSNSSTPEKKLVEKVYKAGEIYDLYKDIKSIISTAKQEVFVIDAYANEDIIDLYLDKLPHGVKMQILTNTPKGNFLNVAQKFKLKHNSNFIVKSNSNCHDRLMFVDNRCFVIGQSIDKAASKKPTYLIEVQNVTSFRNVFQQLFDTGNNIV